jgi:hypothetical protein
MPAKPPLNGTYLAEAPADPAVGNPNADLTLGGQDTAAHAEASESPGVLRPAQRLDAERAERRHQRMLAREASTATRDPGRGEPRKRSTASASRLTAPEHQTLRDSLSVTLLAAVAAGGVLGAILGALSVAGWVIGVLVALLTVVLPAVLRKSSRSA